MHFSRMTKSCQVLQKLPNVFLLPTTLGRKMVSKFQVTSHLDGSDLLATTLEGVVFLEPKMV
jgi:hypothetical protein